MHQKEIYIIIYKRILQTLHGIDKNYLCYGKFQKDLKLFIKQNLFIEIFTVEIYCLMIMIVIVIGNGKLEIWDYHNLLIIHHQIMKYME
ncbi:hypothetical protein C1645_787004 [Glomus cerebriforme]|uniref:Uncharacterized protein n=1 Tax=Glomus cerebriforme TaxID=658196 RepID=A0A397SFX9_9GLOM|nr:hypothetical protein C1645_787004 [Glomus cerebriforme]